MSKRFILVILLMQGIVSFASSMDELDLFQEQDSPLGSDLYTSDQPSESEIGVIPEGVDQSNFFTFFNPPASDDSETILNDLPPGFEDFDPLGIPVHEGTLPLVVLLVSYGAYLYCAKAKTVYTKIKNEKTEVF